MTDDCIFCQMVAGEIPSHTVYEDESTFAFLDINPLARGHTLVIPKDHYETLDDVPPDVAADVFGTISTITPAVEAAVDAPASTVAINNGEVAGQEVPHTHWHIVPRFEDDGGRPIHALFSGADLDDDELEALAEDIRDAQ